MNFKESISIALKAIRINKMRSLLTMLGIIIGVSSVIAVVAIGQGGEAAINKEFESFGVNRIYLGLNWRNDILYKDYFSFEDMNSLERAFDDEIKGISPSYGESGKVSKGVDRKRQTTISINGVSDQYDEIEHFDFVDGRFLTDSDIKSSRKVCFIDEKLAMEIFGRTDVIGENMLVESNYQKFSLTIIGIYESPKSLFAGMEGDQPTNLYIPHTTYSNIFGVDVIWGLEINLAEGISAEETIEAMTSLLERRHGTTGSDNYVGYSAEGQLEMMNTFTGIVTTIISAIAAISLFVGGIGVMNIMLVSVTERTREIGIRKALGARHKDIMHQFLVEAVIISLMGGIIGTILGIILSLIVAAVIKVPPSVDPVIIIVSWLFSAMVGITFGLYPANKAAKLDPIDALRYE